jgi:hypothetical protein
MRTVPISLAFLVMLASCRKQDDNGGVITGNAIVDGQVKHHQWVVPGCRVYIKSNCSVFPGRDTTLYQQSLTADNSGRIHTEHLANGTYCFYATGSDPNFGNVNVWGWNFITISNKPGEVKSYELEIPVSE